MIERTQEWNEGYCQGLIAAAQGLNMKSGGRGGSQASSSLGNGGTTKKPRKKTQGGSKQQHALAGAEGGLATAKKPRRNAKTANGGANQSAES